MARNAAQLVLSNKDLVHMILECTGTENEGLLDEDEEYFLAQFVLVNKVFYAVGIAYLYRYIYIWRVDCEDTIPRNSYAVRLRGLQENSTLASQVRSLEANAVTTEQLNVLLFHMPHVDDLRWRPLALQPGPLKHLPTLPKSLETLNLTNFIPSHEEYWEEEDPAYTYDCRALAQMVFSPSSAIKHFDSEDLSFRELLAVVEYGGDRLDSISINIRYKGQPDADEEREEREEESPEDWPRLFKPLSNLKSLTVSGNLSGSDLQQLPPSIQDLEVCLHPHVLLELAIKLRDPLWLPNLQHIPYIGFEMFFPEQLEALAARPTRSEVLELADITVAALRERPLMAKYASQKAWGDEFRSAVAEHCSRGNYGARIIQVPQLHNDIDEGDTDEQDETGSDIESEEQ